MRHHLPSTFILLSVLVSGACSGATSNNPSGATSDRKTVIPTPTPDDPATRSAREEEAFENVPNQDVLKRVTARRAVVEFVNSSLPGWSLKGMSSQLHEDINAVSVDADLEKESEHVVISFEVRQFVPESGNGAYWLAVPVNKFRFKRLHALTDANLKKQLEDAQTELEDAQTQLANGRP
jgi:hypothetical protein